MPTPDERLPPVLDACCGSKMFWLDREDPRALFVDLRREVHTLPDRSSPSGSRELRIEPDVVADFKALPFADDSFSVVFFDPPHFTRNGAQSWVALKYGTLPKETWREELRRGFVECFRVLKVGGVLVFKWNTGEIPLNKVLALTPHRPLVGNRFGGGGKSRWVIFIKPTGEA